MAQPKLQMVRVEWVDSCSDEGWFKINSLRAKEPTVSHCTTVGFLLKKDRDKVCIVQNMSDTGSVGDLMAIPRRAVNKLTILRK
jgi:hypothetical protein